jgi:hypothetical protein
MAPSGRGPASTAVGADEGPTPETGGINMDDPKVRKEVEAKRRLMERARAGGGGGGGGGGGRGAREWPGGAPGQFLVRKWLVLDLGRRPDRAVHDPWAGDYTRSLHSSTSGLSGTHRSR